MYSARIFPLADKYMIDLSSEKGTAYELIIEPRTGHIIITNKDGNKYVM